MTQIEFKTLTDIENFINEQVNFGMEVPLYRFKLIEGPSVIKHNQHEIYLELRKRESAEQDFLIFMPTTQTIRWDNSDDVRLLDVDRETLFHNEQFFAKSKHNPDDHHPIVKQVVQRAMALYLNKNFFPYPDDWKAWNKELIDNQIDLGSKFLTAKEDIGIFTTSVIGADYWSRYLSEFVSSSANAQFPYTQIDDTATDLRVRVDITLNENTHDIESCVLNIVNDLDIDIFVQDLAKMPNNDGEYLIKSIKDIHALCSQCYEQIDERQLITLDNLENLQQSNTYNELGIALQEKMNVNHSMRP